MTVEDVNKKNVLVGIRFDGHTRELLDWALVKVADPGDRVTALHVCRNSDSELRALLDGYIDEYDELCLKKQVDFTGEVLRGSSIRKILVREAKSRAVMAVIVGISKPHTIGGCASLAKYCAKKLPLTTEVLAIHNGKIVFRRCSTSNLPGCGTDPRPSIYLSGTPSFKLSGTPTFKDGQSEFGDSEMSEIGRNSHEGIQSFEDGWREDSSYKKDEELGSFERHKKSLSAVSTNSLIMSHGPSPTPTKMIYKRYSLAFTIASTVFLSWGLNWPCSVSTLLVTPSIAIATPRFFDASKMVSLLHIILQYRYYMVLECLQLGFHWSRCSSLGMNCRTMHQEFIKKRNIKSVRFYKSLCF